MSLLRSLVLVGCVSLLGASLSLAQQPAAAQEELTNEQKACYLLGHNFAGSLKAQRVNVDLEQVIRGMKEAMAGNKLAMSDEEVQACMTTFTEELQERNMKQLAEESAKNLEDGAAFLKAYGEKEGVVKLEGGLMYRVLKAGEGASPTAEDRVKVFYTGKTTDGEIFDSTEAGAPATFAVGGLIRGMTMGLMKMKVGEKIELVIPSDLAYGEQAPPSIGPNQVLIFDVELLEIVAK